MGLKKSQIHLSTEGGSLLWQEYKFWKFASEETGREKLVDMFTRFASEEQLSVFQKEYLWKAINKDVEKAFVKEAAESNAKLVSTTIKTVLEALPTIMQSAGSDSEEKIEEVADKVGDEVEKASPESNTSSEPSEEKPKIESKDGSTGTVFDHLNA